MDSAHIYLQRSQRIFRFYSKTDLSRSGLVVLQSSMQLQSTRGDGDVCADIAGNSGAVLLDLPPGDVANRLDTPDISSAQYSVAINAALWDSYTYHVIYRTGLDEAFCLFKLKKSSRHGFLVWSHPRLFLNKKLS